MSSHEVGPTASAASLTILTAKLGTPRKLPVFPEECLVGSLGELAKVLAEGTEVPEEFIYFCALTVLGAMCSGDLNADVGLESDTRLYSNLYGESADVKKSSAMRRTIQFFDSLQSKRMPHVENGIGSAEGLSRVLRAHNNVLLCFDELRSFVDKTRVESSVLLPMVASLFESHDWDNATKKATFSIRGARVSLLGCCTPETYERMWTPEAIAIGLINRLSVVGAERKQKVAWPCRSDVGRLAALRSRVSAQLARLPLMLGMSDEAKLVWGDWYMNLPNSVHAKRLDTIGRRLQLLVALITDKSEIDAETVQTVTRLLDYELQIRRLTDPIDAENMIARLEVSIRRLLAERGMLSQRELQKAVHYERYGIWAFKTAMANLTGAGEVGLNKRAKKYQLLVRPE